MNDSIKVGLALGSGSSCCWAHIGIIHILSRIGIEPDVVCGSSIDSIVGASYLAGNIAALDRQVCSLTQVPTQFT